MLHRTILAIESDTPIFDNLGEPDGLRLLARAFCSPCQVTCFNRQLVYLYDVYSHYLHHPDEAIEEFRQKMIQTHPDQAQELRATRFRTEKYAIQA